MSNKWVYTFGNGAAEGKADMRNLLGGKGANLAEMNLVGLPVPAGFTVTTDVCRYYYDNNQTYPADLMDQVRDGVAHIERIMGKKTYRTHHGQEVCRHGKPIIGFCAFGRACIYARHDGYSIESGIK